MSEAAEKYLTKRNRYFSDKRELRERVEDLNDFHREQLEKIYNEAKELERKHEEKTSYWHYTQLLKKLKP